MRLLQYAALSTTASLFVAFPANASNAEFDQRSWIAPSVFGIQIDDDQREDAGTTGIGGQLAVGTALTHSLDAQIRLWDSVTNRVDGDQNRSRGAGLDLIYRHPISSQLSLHALLGVGLQRTEVPSISGIAEYEAQNETADIGFGITQKLTAHGTRSLFEVRHRFEEFDRPTPGSDQLGEWLVNIGLQIPFGAAPAQPASVQTTPVVEALTPEPEPVEVQAAPAAPEPVYTPVTEPVESIASTPVVVPVAAPVATPQPAAAVSIQTTDFFEPNAEPIYFEIDSATPSQSGQETINRLAVELIQQSGLEVVLTGYANDSGNSNYNKELAERRAETIRAALVHRGVSSSRIKKTTQTNNQADGNTSLDSGRRVTVEFR